MCRLVEATSATDTDTGVSVYLPEELIIHILKRLPVKTLFRFMSVCKAWYTLINNPYFISTHLSHQIAVSNNQLEPRYLLYAENSHLSRRCFIHVDNESFDRTLELMFPEFPASSQVFRAATCNGIVCFGHITRLNAVLWNPSLGKILCLEIPHTVPSPIETPVRRVVRVNNGSNDTSKPYTVLSFNYRLFHGIGFDSSSNDYKFVSIATPNVNEGSTIFVSVCVYSLNLGAWKFIETNFVPMGDSFDFGGVPLNGVIYWLVKGSSGGHHRVPVSILTFNLSDETFGEIPLPGGVEYNPISLECMSLMTVRAGSGSEENIAYIHKNRQTLNLWVMEINGVKESWRLVVSLRREDVGLKSIVNACKNGEILVELECGSLAALNPTDLRLKVVSDKYRSMVYLGSYMETLVLFHSNPCLKPSNDLKQKSDCVQLEASEVSS